MRRLIGVLVLASASTPAFAILAAPAPVMGDSTSGALVVAGVVAVYFSVRYLRRRRG
jgi:hypothetical protein